MKTLGLTDWTALHGNHFRGAKVLVTGGAGFIGSHLSEALCALGAKVTVIDDLSGGDKGNLQGFGPVEFVHGTILDRALIERITAGCQYVFHLAALIGIPVAAGDLVLHSNAGDVRMHKPVVYQPGPSPQSRNPKLVSFNPQSSIGDRQSVVGRFVLTASNQVHFQIGPYDKSRPLVIDRGSPSTMTIRSTSMRGSSGSRTRVCSGG